MKARSPRRKKAAAEPVGLLDRSAALFNAVIEARVSTAIAMAIIIFAAGSTMAVAALAAPEIAVGGDAAVGTMPAHRQVLGVSTISIDVALEAGDPTGSVVAKPVSFDSTAGRWNYNINYKFNNLGGSASVTIGTYVVRDGITTSGTVETGAILKPSMHYIVTLWGTDASGGKIRLGKADIKTPKGTSNPANDSNVNDSTKCVLPTGVTASSTPTGANPCPPPQDKHSDSGMPPGGRPDGHNGGMEGDGRPTGGSGTATGSPPFFPRQPQPTGQ